ncbi:hypothetical protein AAFF_G00258640 [Aldrovandia affinis]|uniref:Uncharacterized protein n=1 Tax=Aldrovandia affinis TaxID=143900 RepID=A0AAD7WTI2_9TELE|nr:hypothetical protein AAFF_G00258640 [Aldrovandia affinis]
MHGRSARAVHRSPLPVSSSSMRSELPPLRRSALRRSHWLAQPSIAPLWRKLTPSRRQGADAEPFGAKKALDASKQSIAVAELFCPTERRDCSSCHRDGW